MIIKMVGKSHAVWGKATPAVSKAARMHKMSRSFGECFQKQTQK